MYEVLTHLTIGIERLTSENDKIALAKVREALYDEPVKHNEQIRLLLLGFAKKPHDYTRALQFATTL